MKSFALLVMLAALGPLGLKGQIQMANPYARCRLNLAGSWNVIVDPYEVGFFDYRHQPFDTNPHSKDGFYLDRTPASPSDLVEYSFDRSPTLQVPGDWNSQREQLLWYEGSVWYRRRFEVAPRTRGNRLWLYFGAANYEADVYLNGRKLGHHIGGFTPFAFEITAAVQAGSNSLVVKVDNQRHQEAVPTLNTDWWNYGGLTRDVMVLETPPTFIADYLVQLLPGKTGRAGGFIQLSGERLVQTGELNIPQLGLTIPFSTDEHGLARLDFALPGAQLWSPEHPALYAVHLTCGSDEIGERIGFRTIETRGTDILLNGKPIFLRGIDLHEENPLRRGRAYSEEDARLLLARARELNCNYLRLAHYPHNEFMARVADEMGLMLWEEVPVYWTIEWENPATLANARQQLTDLIFRDKNRASVIIWSIANETPISAPRTRFLTDLAQTARRLDSSRLLSAAMEVRVDARASNDRTVEDPLADVVDVVSFNEYIGWYSGMPDDCVAAHWIIKYQKPVLISELGGDALQGFHGSRLTRFTEEFQADLYTKNLAMLEKIPQLRGISPWILNDFRSPRRLLPGVEDGWNRKGLFGENGTKKQAFYVLKAFYDKKAASLPATGNGALLSRLPSQDAAGK